MNSWSRSRRALPLFLFVLDLGCTGRLIVGRLEGSTSISGTSSGGTSGATSSGGTSTGGSSTGGTSSGGTTSGGCGPGLACFGDQCLNASCLGAPRGASCSLGNGKIGACAGGTCQTPPGNDPQNCGFVGASCPQGLICQSGGACFTSQGENVGVCDGLVCPAGQVCELVGFQGVYCVRSSCGATDDDRICGTGLDGGRAVLGGLSDPSFCCGSSCVDTGSDPANCGGCGIACGKAALCIAPPSSPTQGVCLPTSCAGLASGSTCLFDGGEGVCCGEDCTNLGDDPANCGVCGMECQAGGAGFPCAGGQCAIVDDGGNLLACNAGQACPAGWTCALEGSCVPDCSAAPDGVFCGFSAAERFVNNSAQKVCCDHRCVDPNLDPADCGSCGYACGAGEGCLSGTCEHSDCSQASGVFTPCPLPDGGGGICCGGACVDTTRDVENCGECRLVCPVGASCDFASCSDAGSPQCGGPCPSGSRCSLDVSSCLPTSCGINDTGALCAFGDGGVFPDDGLCCDGVCVDVTGDPQNCGTCGVACGVGDQCELLGCNPGHATCGVDGGPQCAPGLVCLGEVLCEPLFCDGRANGESCLFGFTESGPNAGICCGQRCVDITQDPRNCGGCGIVSSDSLCRGPLNSSACIDSACADLSTDPQHCGNCLIACPAGQTCANGTCSGSPGCGPGHAGAFCDPDAGVGVSGLPLLCCPGFGCIDVAGDSQNCGSCGTECPSGKSCRQGQCG